jgi:hypothetical protein
LNKFTGLYHNDDGTRQFKGEGKGQAAGLVGGANDWHQSKSKVVAEGQSVDEIKEGHKSHHHSHHKPHHSKHAHQDKTADKAVEKKAAKKVATKTEKVHA